MIISLNDKPKNLSRELPLDNTPFYVAVIIILSRKPRYDDSQCIFDGELNCVEIIPLANVPKF
jgi:hypothetical protein